MNNIETFLTAMLWLHIGGGTSALLSGLGAMLTKKGMKGHRLFGKVYFWSMTTVFVSALILAVGHDQTFLLMVAFFSYYFTVRGYRVLYLKKLGRGQSATWLDWVITLVAGTFDLGLIGWGTYVLINGNSMGIVAVFFGVLGITFLAQDVRSYVSPTTSTRTSWMNTHIASMGGSYISATTAFVVVNITLPTFGWTLWIIPSLVGSILIGRTIRRYKVQSSEYRVNI